MVASQLFSPEDRKAVSDAVTQAEKKTAGEIVPVVATASDRYERAEDLFGLLVAGVVVSAAWLGWMGVRPATGDWVTGPELSLGLVHVLGLFGVGWFVGMKIAGRVPFFKHLLVPRAIMRARVIKAGEASFASLAARGTKAATGIVIYVSLFERIVYIRADRGIAKQVPPAEWKTICDDLTRALKSGKPREGLVAAIGKVGDHLSKHFPVQPDDVNELSNELRILD
jgi:putative membrane protein